MKEGRRRGKVGKKEEMRAKAVALEKEQEEV